MTQGRALAGIAATTIPQPQVMLTDSQDVAVLGSAFPYEQTAPQTPLAQVKVTVRYATYQRATTAVAGVIRR